MKPWEDPNHQKNGPQYRTGKPCIDCSRPAGTAWSKLWCQKCNAERINRIDNSLDAMVEAVIEAASAAADLSVEHGDPDTVVIIKRKKADEN